MTREAQDGSISPRIPLHTHTQAQALFVTHTTAKGLSTECVTVRVAPLIKQGIPELGKLVVKWADEHTMLQPCHPMPTSFKIQYTHQLQYKCTPY